MKKGDIVVCTYKHNTTISYGKDWLRFTSLGGVDCIWRWFSTKQNIRDKKLKELGI
jgi:hypothetical protein